MEPQQLQKSTLLRETDMPANQLPVGSFVSIDRAELQVIIETLKSEGYRTVGPRVADQAVVYQDLDSIDQLPIGVIEEQAEGKYRISATNRDEWFLFTNGPDSLKKYLFPPREILLESKRQNGQWTFQVARAEAKPVAVIGARACDLHAVEIQDRTFLHGQFVDEAYRRRRENLFIVAVNCSRAAPTCFCHSLKCGPGVTGAYDLVLTELDQQFVVVVGSLRGGATVASTRWRPCTLEDVERAKAITKELEEQMRNRTLDDNPRSVGRELETHELRELLLDNLDHPHWQQVADRCLACGNCTLVCPTCFCAAIEEVSDLAADNVSRQRVWDSCFTAEHSYMNSGTVRKSIASRYRQWLTHKLATWQDQFGTIGCVGCGRCITWCPVGIDLTEEVSALRRNGA